MSDEQERPCRSGGHGICVVHPPCSMNGDNIERLDHGLIAVRRRAEDAEAKLCEWQLLDDEIRATLKRVTPSDKARDIAGSIVQLAAERDEARAEVADLVDRVATLTAERDHHVARADALLTSLASMTDEANRAGLAEESLMAERDACVKSHQKQNAAVFVLENELAAATTDATLRAGEVDRLESVLAIYRRSYCATHGNEPLGANPMPCPDCTVAELAAARAREVAAVAHLTWTLPMAKGYAAAHPVGANADKVVAGAAEFLDAIRAAPPPHAEATVHAAMADTADAEREHGMDKSPPPGFNQAMDEIVERVLATPPPVADEWRCQVCGKNNEDHRRALGGYSWCWAAQPPVAASEARVECDKCGIDQALAAKMGGAGWHAKHIKVCGGKFVRVEVQR